MQTETNRKGPLTATEQYIIGNALRVAADQYDNDAAQGAEFGMSDRTVKAFHDQAESARKWADLIENANEVTIK